MMLIYVVCSLGCWRVVWVSFWEERARENNSDLCTSTRFHYYRRNHSQPSNLLQFYSETSTRGLKFFPSSVQLSISSTRQHYQESNSTGALSNHLLTRRFPCLARALCQPTELTTHSRMMVPNMSIHNFGIGLIPSGF